MRSVKGFASSSEGFATAGKAFTTSVKAFDSTLKGFAIGVEAFKSAVERLSVFYYAKVKNREADWSASVPLAHAAFFSGVTASINNQVEYQSRRLSVRSEHSWQAGRLRSSRSNTQALNYFDLLFISL